VSRRYHILDVFTHAPLAGNPLAVVHDSDGLSSEAMQAIAREFNLSETVFLLPPDHPVHTARTRIFTPHSELPFAGHPTVGTAILLATLRGTGDGIVVLEQPIGPVRVGVTFGDTRIFAEFDMPVLPEAVDHPVEIELAATALGLLPSEICFENHRPGRWKAGSTFAFVPVRDLDVLGRCRIERRAFDEAFGPSVYVYCRETRSRHHHFHARMFAPGLGIAEDPATGSATGALAGVIMHYDRPVGGTHRYRIEQGHFMDRPSLIELELVVNGALEVVRIGGGAVLVAEGQLNV
jgi:trans-2,3-dihydro-3-hydroxyanthranilate isomerase